MREHDAWFELAAQGLAHQRFVGCIIIQAGPLGPSGQLLEYCGEILGCGAPRHSFSDGKLEGAQMIATFQPDGAEKAVEVAESAVGGCLQMHPILGRVTGFDDQMEPAWSCLARHGGRVVFPAGFEMIGHLAFAKRSVAKPAFGGGEFVVKV
jgi:hypothetical protein